MRIEVTRHGVEDGVALDWIRGVGETVLCGEDWSGKGSLSIVLIDDKDIRELNRRFLRKDRPTDVMAFPFGDEDIWGEVYVNEERAKEQALMYEVTFDEELMRLVIHGVLHLIGYDDTNEEAQKKMREREDYYLNQILKEST